MLNLAAVSSRLAGAADLAAVLGAAYDAFEDVLAILRRYQDSDEGVFAAFVFAACAAADGRDWIAAAPTLPLVPSPVGAGSQAVESAAAPDAVGAADVVQFARVLDVAGVVAQVSKHLATQLTACAVAASDPADRESCTRAAGEAAKICALMGGASPP